MAKLGIAKDFLADYAKLQKPVQKSVSAVIDKFAAHTHAGIHLEKLANAKDSRIRTIRITQFYRGVVLAPTSGDEFLLLTVLPHDDAIEYATSRRFTVNQALGVLEVRNQQALDSIEPALQQAARANPSMLFSRVNDADLIRLGVDADILPLVRLLTTEAHLEALANLLPAAQYDALTGLAAGYTPEQVWDEVSAHLPTSAPAEPVDPDDLAAAAARTPDRFHLVSGPAELASILAHPFDAWRVFLHPTQREIAHRPSYAGPALVTGGAGTGKTVTALHRAVFLAARITGGPDRLLLTTFTRNLADALDRQLGLLTDDAPIRDRIDVLNVDRLAYRIVAETLGRQPVIADARTVTRPLWEQAADATGGQHSATFLQREWEQVILAQGITEPAGYLAARRHGRGAPLRADQRLAVWEAIRQVTDALRQQEQYTHLQLADQAAKILAERPDRPYRHVIVDEGQDLHPAQWRLLRAAVAAGPDDLFIVADPHQRIYDNHVSLGSLGVGIRGRSRKLTINYRTTQEILAWSVRLLTGVHPTGLDDQQDDLTGYRSPMHGRRPRVAGHPDRDAEHDQLVTQVRSWIDDGVEPHAIAVAARNGHLARAARDRLGTAGIPVSTPTASKTNAVRVGTMHAMKGLEFRCVAAIGVDADTMPARSTITAADDDPTAHRHDLQRERCLLFVACTRARDSLYVSYAGAPSPFLDARPTH
ncbi:exodeoxyribonuclease V subunit gamma [Solwaraspora sp. WMMA2080]|uniref:UvrD-helicase domain-containing protein n=1 Tax=unclassified Solwaraspora TaxID=2627926 RepID=UPI00248C4D57|nr:MULTISPECIES: UvrD-helicase domain-containing protein [unclassified Solwaraspora]WBB96994.1 exodeoxyribonuclease V subunit gamma [Solwaraspora sp. WMMA2059]WBC19102.1 exodeoxyribonuclease V subunit gamma [Solwaraspora sp. WMMA2080]